MDWGKIFDFLSDLLTKIVEVGQYAYTWLTSDLNMGT